jgi:hypothetical protein
MIRSVLSTYAKITMYNYNMLIKTLRLKNNKENKILKVQLNYRNFWSHKGLRPQHSIDDIFNILYFSTDTHLHLHWMLNIKSGSWLISLKVLIASQHKFSDYISSDK